MIFLMHTLVRTINACMAQAVSDVTVGGRRRRRQPSDASRDLVTDRSAPLPRSIKRLRSSFGKRIH